MAAAFVFVNNHRVCRSLNWLVFFFWFSRASDRVSPNRRDSPISGYVHTRAYYYNTYESVQNISKPTREKKQRKTDRPKIRNIIAGLMGDDWASTRVFRVIRGVQGNILIYSNIVCTQSTFNTMYRVNVTRIASEADVMANEPPAARVCDL